MDMSVSLGTPRESCECEASVSIRHIYPGSFFLELEDDMEPSLWVLVRW
jgi:hypothetical protein